MLMLRGRSKWWCWAGWEVKLCEMYRCNEYVQCLRMKHVLIDQCVPNDVNDERPKRENKV